MTDSDFQQRMIKTMTRIEERLGGVDGRLGGVEGRLSNVESGETPFFRALMDRLGNVERGETPFFRALMERVGSIDTRLRRLTLVASTRSGVLALQRRVEAVENLQDVEEIEARLEALERVVFRGGRPPEED